jgi:DNA-binding CsgD family transcriptional regulator
MTNGQLPATVLPFPARTPALSGQSADLSGPALEVYRLLARQGELTLGDLASSLGVPREQARVVVDELARLTLVRETDGGAVAVPPDQAVDRLLAEQAGVLTLALERLSDAQRRLRTIVGGQAVLEPSRAAQITATMVGDPADGVGELVSEATASLGALHPGGVFTEEVLHRSLARARDNARREVPMRVVHQSSVLSRPAMVGYLHQLAASGCRIRVRDNLPFRLILIDGTSALCSVPSGGSFLLTGERVLVLLSRVFETTWVDAVPLERAQRRADPAAPVGNAPAVPVGTAEGTPPEHGVGMSPVHEAILRLLAEGQTDSSIARSMGITSRTVTRRIGEIYSALGVASRFQAGIAAKELGIV